MTACRSAGPNELTRSSVVGEADGEGDVRTDGLTDAVGLPGEIGVGAGVCASALMARKRPIKTHNVN